MRCPSPRPTAACSARTPRWPLVLLIVRTAVLYSTQTALTTVLLLSFHGSGASGGYLSAVLLAVSVPLMLVAPFAGSLADRTSGRPLIAGGGALQILAVAGQSFDPPQPATIGLVVIYAAGMAVVAASLQVELPSLVPLDQLGRATGWASAAQTTAFMTGPLCAASIFDEFGRRPALLAVLCGCVAVTLSAALPRSRAPHDSLPVVVLPSPAASPIQASIESRARWFGGLWVIDRVSLVVVMYTGALALTLHPTAVIEVLLVRESLGASATVLGVVGAGWSVGMVLGSLVAGRLTITTRALTRWMLIAGGIQAAFLAAAGFSHAPWLLVVMYMIGGFWCGGTNVARQTLLTVRAPEGRRGRALALVVAVHNGVQALGLGLGGLVVELYDPRIGYLLCGSLGVVVTVAFAPWMARATQRAAAQPGG